MLQLVSEVNKKLNLKTNVIIKMSASRFGLLKKFPFQNSLAMETYSLRNSRTKN